MNKTIPILFTIFMCVFCLPDVHAREVNYLKPDEVKTGYCDVWAAIFIAKNRFILGCDNSAELWQTSEPGLSRFYEKANTNWTDLMKGPESNYFSTILNDGVTAEIWKVTTDGVPTLVSHYSKPALYQNVDTQEVLPGFYRSLSGNISSVLFVNKYMLVIFEGGSIVFNLLNDSIRLEPRQWLSDNNVTSLAIDTNTKKMAIALENNKHEVMLWNLAPDEDGHFLHGSRPVMRPSLLSTARKMTFASDDKVLAAVTDSGLEFRNIKDWSKLNHVALSQNCIDMAYSENRDIFIGICNGRKAYLFQHGRNSQYDIESLNPVRFVTFDWNSGENRFAVVLESGDVALWRLIYEGTSSDGAAYYYPLKLAVMHHNSVVDKINFGSSGQLLTVSAGKATFWNESAFLIEKEPVDIPAEIKPFSNSVMKNSLVSLTLFVTAWVAHHTLIQE